MQEYFSQLNKYYDKIYVLSVESAENRRALFTDRFNGLDYSFFFGADKNHFSIPELEEKHIYSEELTRRHHRFSLTMKPGEIACSWSHKMIYEDMLAHTYDRILVFEDDALPDPAQLKKIPAILDEIPADCELLMWGWEKNGIKNAGTGVKQLLYHVQHSLGILKWDHKLIRNLYARNYSRHLKKAGFHDYAVAYGMSRSCAEKFLALQTPIQYIADNLLAHAATKGIVNGYITWPQVFLHDNLPDGTHRDSYIR